MQSQYPPGNWNGPYRFEDSNESDDDDDDFDEEDLMEDRRCTTRVGDCCV